VFLLSAVAAVLALQLLYVLNSAAGAPKDLAQRKVHAADSRELVAAGNMVKAVSRPVHAKPAPLAFTGPGAIAPTITISLMLMLDGALVIWLAKRPQGHRA
jgi:hypothetical protein